MSALSKSKIPVFNILSLGQRGVGKTVFLAGAYVQLNYIFGQVYSKEFWLDCSKDKDRKNLQGILDYVSQTGKYPPPTLKITDFLFRVQQRNRWTNKMTPVCQLRCWDIPGETCKFEHPDFQEIILNSHSCCVFINGYQLATDSSYLATLDEIIQQVIAIASLIQHTHHYYPFALIFTQCDRLNPEPIGRLQIEKNLQPLIKALKAVEAKYQRFYTGIPIVRQQNRFQLEASGAEGPFLWLIEKLYSIHCAQSSQTLASVIKQDAPPPRRLPSIKAILSNTSTKVILSSLGLLVLTGGIWFSWSRLTSSYQQSQNNDPLMTEYLETLKDDPEHLGSLVGLAERYLALQELDKAIPIMEKIVEITPENLNWQLNLAQLYKLTEQREKAETLYDRILAQDTKNFQALVNKALLRKEDQDYQTAQIFFRKAEQAAPNQALKEKVRQIQKTPD